MDSDLASTTKYSFDLRQSGSSNKENKTFKTSDDEVYSIINKYSLKEPLTNPIPRRFDSKENYLKESYFIGNVMQKLSTKKKTLFS